MSIVQRIRETLSTDSQPDVRTYDCVDCGETHVSAKDPDRASCPECLSTDLTVVEDG